MNALPKQNFDKRIESEMDDREELQNITSVIDSSQNLPTGAGATYAHTFESYRGQSEALSRRSLNVLESLASYIDPSRRGIDSINADETEEWQRHDSVLDAIDNALDRVDLALSSTTPNSKVASSFATSKTSRPQDRFHDKVDNSSNTPFIPKLTSKPFAMSPLSTYSHIRPPQSRTEIPQSLSSHLQQLGHSPSLECIPESIPNPYIHEIEALVYTDLYCSTYREQPRYPRDLAHTPCTWIDSEVGLNDLKHELEKCMEFAIDLEHHSYHSYLGFTCLIQISTVEQDYLIDALELRHCLQMLNTSFCNPNIVKIFHGADRDILWLQRDFGLYVVNMFDTGQAARVLQYSSFSLAHLLRKHCQVECDKRYQTADWRHRPLPVAMITYARVDTHYLIYIYDVLVKELVRKSRSASYDLHRAVLMRSRDLCLQTFTKPRLTPYSHLKLLAKYKIALPEAHVRVLRALLVWRDTLARQLDESVAYVLPTKTAIEMAQDPPFKTEQAQRQCRLFKSTLHHHTKSLIDAVTLAYTSKESTVLTVPVGASENEDEMLWELTEEEVHHQPEKNDLDEVLEFDQDTKDGAKINSEFLASIGWVEGEPTMHESDQTAALYNILMRNSSRLFDINAQLQGAACEVDAEGVLASFEEDPLIGIDLTGIQDTVPIHPDYDIPQTMEEIHHLSAQIREENKSRKQQSREKVSLGDESTEPPCDLVTQTDRVSVEVEHQPINEFLTEIGWRNENDPPLVPEGPESPVATLKRSTNSSGGSGRSRSGRRRQNLQQTNSGRRPTNNIQRQLSHSAPLRGPSSTRTRHQSSASEYRSFDYEKASQQQSARFSSSSFHRQKSPWNPHGSDSGSRRF